MAYIKLILVTIIFLFSNAVNFVLAQDPFVDRCLGEWSGLMYMYNYGNLRDSVSVRFLAARTDSLDTWIWRTSYLSESQPLVKDYKLKKSSKGKNQYFIDEGEGIVLFDYLFGDKLYGVFETERILLTSSYELTRDRLIFEVTSGKKIISDSGQVENYSIDHVQRVVLKRLKK